MSICSPHFENKIPNISHVVAGICDYDQHTKRISNIQNDK